MNDLFLNELEEETVHDFRCPRSIPLPEHVHDISNIQNSCGQSGVKRKVMPDTRPRYLFVHVTKHNSG